jgi:hypothetical protein
MDRQLDLEEAQRVFPEAVFAYYIGLHATRKADHFAVDETNEAD